MTWKRPSAASALVTAALVIGIMLRIWLALVNAEANDSHLGVIRIIAFEHRFPAKAEDWEAFQPKLYHTTVAIVWRLMRTTSPLALARAAQLVSCAAGVATLLVMLRFLRERALPAEARAIAFATAALSPSLVATSVQATNDAFVILFASLTLYFGARFFARWRRGDFLALCAAAVLAGISKGNGLVVIVAVGVTFAVASLAPRALTAAPSRQVPILYGVAFAVLVAPAVALIGPYAGFQREFGTPFVTNWTPSPRPHLFRETISERPGLTSVAHGLLTFRLVDLLRHPSSTDDRIRYPRHRTSVWSRVYAQAHSLRFESWPPSWESASRGVRNLTRLLLLLGLLPTALLAAGGLALARDAVHRWWSALRQGATAVRRGEPWTATVLLLAATAGYLAFVALYAVRLRDYSSMKHIFVLPALLGLAAFVGDGASHLAAWCAARRGGAALARAATAGLLLLLAAYTADVGVLIRDLGREEQWPNDGSPRPGAGVRARTPSGPTTQDARATTFRFRRAPARPDRAEPGPGGLQTAAAQRWPSGGHASSA